ncbi:MAG: GNAT family N-acetyltransferase [Rhodobacteraceae bacterium]|nr:GNAT family N-acetyltransferase [Paracoccaceae bacterium]
MTEKVFAAIDATWPAAHYSQAGPWCIREGRGGGQRVSAASTRARVTATDVAEAETAMQALGQPPVFMIRGDQPRVDSVLDRLGYRMKEPVGVWSGPVKRVAEGYERSLATIFAEYPMPILAEIWAAGGIGPARLDIMRRTAGPKTCILGRCGDRPRGAAFVAMHQDVAMAHAVEVCADARRQGVAERMMKAAAWWAGRTGAAELAVLTAARNTGTQAMLGKLGMRPVTHYHYRVKRQGGTAPGGGTSANGVSSGPGPLACARQSDINRMELPWSRTTPPRCT